jgi:DNA helicase HerA-like ATPase
MTTPNKQQIVEKAIELWHRDRAKSDDPSFDINPEIVELRESGYLSSAKSELMRNPESKNVEWLDTSKDAETSEFQFDLEEAMKSGVLVSGTTGTGKSDLAMYLTDQLMKEGVLVIVFDSSQDWQKRSSIPLYETLTIPYIDKIPENSVVFDISRLSVEQRQKLIEGFSQKLYQDQVMNLFRKEYFLIFEEGGTYFKEGFMRGKRFSNTSMLMSEGRNYDVRFMVITQFFASIDKTAMRYMKQRYFGYTDEKNDVSYVKAFLGDQASKLKDLRAGEFMYYNAGKTTKISIEPYECENTKTEIPQPSILPEPKLPQPIRTNESVSIALAKLAIIAIFAIATIVALR